jgi:hypothetical protein
MAWRNNLGDGGGGEGVAGPGRGDERFDGHCWTCTRELLRRGGPASLALAAGTDRQGMSGPGGGEHGADGLRLGNLSVPLRGPGLRQRRRSIYGGAGGRYPSAAVFTLWGDMRQGNESRHTERGGNLFVIWANLERLCWAKCREIVSQ